MTSARRNIAWYALPRLLSRGAALLLLPVYTRVLTPAELGVAMVVLALGSLGSLVVTPGIEGTYVRWTSQRPAAGGAGTLLRLHLGLLALGVGVLLAGARPISALLLPGIPSWPFYYVIVATLALTSLEAPLRAGWRAEHRADKVARLDAADLVISTGTILAALLILHWGPISLLLGDLAASVVLLPLYVRPVVSRLRDGWDGQAFARIAPIALVGLPLSLSGYVLSSLDRVILHRYAGPGAVGLYAAAFQIGAAIMAVTITLNKEWQPLIFQLAGRTGDQAETLQRLWTRSLCLFFLFGSLISCFSVEIVRWWLGPQYAASAPVIPWVALMCMLRIARSFLTNLSLAVGKTGDLTVESLCSIAVFAAANVALVPVFGIQGAAWAGVVTYAAGAVFLFTRSWNVFHVDRRLTAWIAVVLGAIVLGWTMGGTVVTKAAGIVMVVLVAYEAVVYWRFLGTLAPARIEP